MLKMRSTLFTCLSLACLIMEIHGHYRQVNFTKQWAANTDSLIHLTDVVKANDRLFAVTLSDVAVTITSIFDSIESKTCDHNALVTDETFGDIDFAVFALGNGKIVVRARALAKSDFYSDEGPKRVGQDVFIIVDPIDCSSLKTIKVPRQLYRILLTFVPYQSTFDLIYRSRPTENTPNAPQRYNDQGEQVELNYFLSKESEISPKFKIVTRKPYDPSAGYIVATDTNGQLVLRHLDSRFEKIMETPIEKSIESLSTANGDITYCQMTWYSNLSTSKNEPQKQCICHFFNAELSKKTTVSIVKPNHVGRAVVTNLSDGGAVVAVADEVEREYDDVPNVIQYYLQRIDADGKAHEPVMVVENTIWHYKMKMFDMGNGQICLYNGGETVSFKGHGTLKYGAWINCVNVSDL